MKIPDAAKHETRIASMAVLCVGPIISSAMAAAAITGKNC